jgi:hypothetical protein
MLLWVPRKACATAGISTRPALTSGTASEEATAMPADLVELLKCQIGPRLIGPVGQLLAMSEDKARNSVHLAIPALLASLGQVAARPEGGGVLSAAVKQHCTTNVGTVNASAPYVLAERGLETLDTLLGPGTVESLASALGNVVGVNVRGGSLLLGVVAPATLAYLGERPVSVDQGARGVAKLLCDQRSNIAAALPANLPKLMGSDGQREGTTVGTPAGQAARAKAAGAMSPSVTAMSNDASTTSGRADGGVSLIQAMGLLIAGVLIVGISQYIFGGRVPAVSQRPPDIVPRAAQPFASLVVGDVDLGAQFGGEIVRLGQTLAGVTDVASAKAALPALDDILGSLNKVNGLAGQLPDSARARLADLAARAMPILQVEMNNANAIPGAADLLKPVVDPLRTSIATLAKKWP